MDALTACLLGSLIGLATGLVPGLHVNTLAALGLAVLASDGGLVLLLVAAGTVHTIVNIVPATYLGAPDEDDVLVVLPAHRLMLSGLGPEAVAISVRASLTAVLVAAAGVTVYARLLHGGLASLLDDVMPFILAGVVIVLIVQEAARSWRAAAWALLVQACACGLGILAFRVPLGGWAPAPATPLLPLLAGLFGAAGMIASMGRPPVIPCQWRDRPRPVPLSGLVWGIAASAGTAVLPGLTSSVAAALAPRSDDPRRAVALLSSVNTAHAVLALHVLLVTGAVRTGLADAVRLSPALAAWTVSGPTTFGIQLLAVIVAAGALGAAGTLALDRLVSPRVDRVPARALAAGALVMLAILTTWLTGWAGLLLGAASAALGLVPLAAGIRRVHLVACLIGPILIRAWT